MKLKNTTPPVVIPLVVTKFESPADETTRPLHFFPRSLPLPEEPVLNAATILYTDDEATLHYANGIEVEFSRAQLAKILEIKRRPVEERIKGKHDGLQRIPTNTDDFSLSQRRCYAEVHGDAIAEELWGDGPWLRKWQTKRYTDRRSARKESL